jgi:hypothetical protein
MANFKKLHALTEVVANNRLGWHLGWQTIANRVQSDSTAQILVPHLGRALKSKLL